MTSEFVCGARTCRVHWGDTNIMFGEEAVVFDPVSQRLAIVDIHGVGEGEFFTIPREPRIYTGNFLKAVILGRVLN